jgi:putative transposase
MDDLPHRKQIHHIHEPHHCHELTFSCYQGLPLLLNDEWKQLFSRALNTTIPQQGFRLVAFVYMPEHVHLLVFPLEQTAQINRLLFAIKRPFSYQVKQQLAQNDDPLLRQLTIRERPGKQVFRFWQEGPGYDRNIVAPRAIQASIDYIHNNPVRRGLSPTPAEWRWSSWRHYHTNGSVQDSALPIVHGVPEW